MERERERESDKDGYISIQRKINRKRGRVKNTLTQERQFLTREGASNKVEKEPESKIFVITSN